MPLKHLTNPARERAKPNQMYEGSDDEPGLVGAFHKNAAKMGIDEKQLFKRVAKLSLRQLIHYTPQHIRNNRLEHCRTYFYISEYYKREGKRGMRIFAYKTGCNKDTYMTQIGFVDYTKNLQSSVWVHCSCKYFKFNLEYVLAQLGATNNIFAWNSPPHIKNPNMVPGACKHILNVVDDALKRTRQFAKLDKNKELELTSPEIDIQPDKSKEYDPLKGPEKTKQQLQKVPFKPFSPNPVEAPSEKSGPFSGPRNPSPTTPPSEIK